MDDSSYRRNFNLDKKNESHYHSWKEHVKMSKIASLVAKCCKYEKYSPMKLVILSILVLRAEKCTTFGSYFTTF